MCSNARNEQEMVGYDFAHVANERTARCANNEHHVFVGAPCAACLEHLFKKAFSAFVLEHLEIQAALVACKGEHDSPFVLVVGKRSYAVAAHVGCHGNGIGVHAVEESVGIHLGRVAYVASLCVDYHEMLGIFLFKVGYGFFECRYSGCAVALVECGIGFVGYTVGCCGVDYSFVEFENCVVVRLQACRNLGCVGVETDAKKRLAFAYG